MKILLCFFIPLMILPEQMADMAKIRQLFQRSPLNKHDAVAFNKWATGIDTGASPVLVCYKGANTMIQAKYTINPITKLRCFQQGKLLVEAAIIRDTLNLEMRFIRFSIQNNLPAFLGYQDHVQADKRFLLLHTRDNEDADLRQTITNYLSTLPVIDSTKLKKTRN